MLTKKIFSSFLVQLFILLIFSSHAFSLSSGSLKTYATLHSIGIEWNVSDDANHNGSCRVSYRKDGTSSWTEAMPLYRVDFNSYDMLAGSIFFLNPETTYEVKLHLEDPDGGNTSQSFSITTKPEPSPPTKGRTLYVISGDGGGSGQADDPYRGITEAQNQAVPGDTFLLAPGTYSGETEFTVSGSPTEYIVWKAAGGGKTILDTIRINGDHIWLEGLHVEGNTYGIRTYNEPQDVVVTKNTFTGCHYCIYLNHGGTGWYITDNIIYGDVEPSSGDFGGEGIELQHSDDHTVAYNSITHVADGVSYPGNNCDIFGNDIFDVSDDGIEPDYGHVNIRVWENRISNALHNGISFQPMNGAPWYILRNQVAAPLENGIKFRDQVDRALIAHNTFVGWQGAQKSGSEHLLSVQSNNNLWISMNDWYAWENGSGGSANWKTNLDYDGFDWGNHVYAFKWGERYSTLSAFSDATGLQKHGIRIRKETCFAELDIPSQPPASMPKQFMTLNSTCNAVDAGIVLAGINSEFTGSAPDLGAYEYGAPMPQYGPRTSSSEPLPTPPSTPGAISIAPCVLPLLLKGL